MKFLFSFSLAILATLSLSSLAAADEIGDKIKILASGSSQARETAFKDLQKLGYDGAKAAHLSNEKDKDFQAYKKRLTAPYKARLYWDAWKKRGVTGNLIGRLKGYPYFLGRKIGYAEMTVFARPNGSMRIVTKGNGKLQSYSGKVEVDSVYDEFLHLKKLKFKATWGDKKSKQSGSFDQVWTKVKGKSTLTHDVFHVFDKVSKRGRQVKIERGAVFADLFVVIGRGLDYKSKKIQRVALNIINPEEFNTIEVAVKSVRREKTVAKGGARVQALRLEADIPLPKEFGEPKAWITPDQKPVKGRLGGFTIYGITTFEKVKEKVKPEDKKPVTPGPKPKVKPAPKGKRKFF